MIQKESRSELKDKKITIEEFLTTLFTSEKIRSKILPAEVLTRLKIDFLKELRQGLNEKVVQGSREIIIGERREIQGWIEEFFDLLESEEQYWKTKPAFFEPIEEIEDEETGAKKRIGGIMSEIIDVIVRKK